MKDRDAHWAAGAAGATIVAGEPRRAGPARAVVDTRAAGPGDLFVGLAGAHHDGGEFAAAALAAGAWGVLVSDRHAAAVAADAPRDATILGVADPLAALGSLARAWRRELACKVVGITGSTGKTSTKDILAALLAPTLRVHRNSENLNTEIGLPLTILEAEPGTEVLVLEMAMRGEGQIAELVAIAEPDVGVIVNVGPVHLELLGTVERVAAAKAELIRDLPRGAACVVPAGEALLRDHLRSDLDTIAFGPGGDVVLLELERAAGDAGGTARIECRGEIDTLELSYSEPHNLLNTLAAVGAVHALGHRPSGRVEPAFSALRGEIVELAGGVTVVNDCYNANPMSMRAALTHLAESPAERRVALLGEMAELGADAARYHREVGHRAAELEIDVLVTVGVAANDYATDFDGETYAAATPEEAGALLEEIVRPGDRVLVKGSRSARLEKVLDA